MEYSPEFISDFARRTLHNLDRIKQAEDEGEVNVYPVTQLWNSLLGLIVLPRERDGDRIPKMPISDLWAGGRPLVTERKGASRTLRQLVTSLRNAVAHGGVKFDPDEHGEIVSLTLWNLPRGEWDQPRESRTWEGFIAEPDLEPLARLIAETYAEAFARV
jgi:hypothetical protein